VRRAWRAIAILKSAATKDQLCLEQILRFAQDDTHALRATLYAL